MNSCTKIRIAKKIFGDFWENQFFMKNNGNKKSIVYVITYGPKSIMSH